MNLRIFVYIFVLLFLITSAFALGNENTIFESYTHTVKLEERNTDNEIVILARFLQKTSEFNLSLPLKVENIKILIDDQEKQCNIKNLENSSLLQCSIAMEGKHFIRINYNTPYPIIKVGDKVLYKSEYLPFNPTSDFNYILKLPVGYLIPKDKDLSFFVNPKPNNIYSDGRRIILRWTKQNVLDSFELSVLMESSSTFKPSLKSFAFIIALLFLIIIIAFLYLKKKKKREFLYPALVEQEQVIIYLLKKAKDNVLWQKQIEIQSKFSKVKVSRILRSLEERKMIRKEPWGNTNKVHLIYNQNKEIEVSESQVQKN